MKHIVMYSGGACSYIAAKRVLAKHGAANTLLVFTDTLIEDADLYRFLNESADKLGAELLTLKEGRDPWQVFKDKRFIGNSRIDPCSLYLKREPFEKWLKSTYKAEDCVLYVGLDWTEPHRWERMQERWKPYRVEAPATEKPLLFKDQMLREIEADGLKPPRLYAMGFAHNNCGGFCVKAGQGHFANLLRQLPDRYKEHEAKEEEMRGYLGKDVSILSEVIQGEKIPLTLRQLRERIEADGQIELFEIGGCGCMVDEVEA